MPRPSNTDERRSQIVTGLIQVMAKRGYDGASVQQIAKAAKLTPGLVHYHFANKQQILLAALDELVARHQEGLDAHLALAGDHPPAQVAAFLDYHLGLGATADPDALACWILLSGEALRQEAVREPLEHALAEIEGKLASLLVAGHADFGPIDPPAAAAALVATIQGYFVLAAVSRDLVPAGSALAAARKMAEGLLGTTLPEAPSEAGR
ncbi:MAG: TetR/AcrR family transcriptional regulator [Polyangiaceae bacterium]